MRGLAGAHVHPFVRMLPYQMYVCKEDVRACVHRSARARAKRNFVRSTFLFDFFFGSCLSVQFFHFSESNRNRHENREEEN